MSYAKKYTSKYTKRSTVFNPRQRSAVNKMVEKKVKYMSEWKFACTSMNAGISTAGNIQSLSDISQGTLDTERVGDTIMPSSIECRYQVLLGDTYNHVRLILFHWSPSGTTPTVADVLSLTVGLEWLSCYNTDKAQNYKIIYDKTLYIQQAVSGAATSTPSFRVKKRLGRKIQYTAGTTVGSNKIYALTISDSGAVAHPNLQGLFKLNFRDG